MVDSHLLRAGQACARFSAQGAQCLGWRLGTREILWPGDDAIWSSVAPVLFPTCGWSRGGHIRIGQQTYPMPVHGFASLSYFDVTQLSESVLRFTSRDSNNTRQLWPFSFALSITYTLQENALSVACEIENHDMQIMPYAIGLHPGFALDWQAGAHHLVFEKPELAEVPVIAPGGLFSARKRPVPLKARVIDLTPALFEAEALCFLDTQSRSFVLEGPDSRLAIAAPDFPHLVLWNKDAAPFLAIESWTGMGDLEGFEGSIFERPSMIHLASGASRTHHVRYSWEPLGRDMASA